LCDVKTHVLRYWEQEFDQLKPVKRRGNRRYYQPHEVQLVRDIRGLLYDQGFTINGARAILESKTSRPKLSDAPWIDPEQAGDSGMESVHHERAAPSHSAQSVSGLDSGQVRSAQDAMAGLIGAAHLEISSSPSFDLPAFKRELQSILDVLESE
jgi:DNA-binding transcriptional MerR regulator